MKNYRVIYQIEVITEEGQLIARRYARNKRAAEKIARKYNSEESVVRKMQKAEHSWINPAWVED